MYLRRLCRLAVIFRRPLHELASWPAYEVELLEAFLQREPSAEQRVEVAVARLCEMFVQAWGNSSGPRPKVTDFLPYLDAWKVPMSEDARYSDVDREVMSAFGMR